MRPGGQDGRGRIASAQARRRRRHTATPASVPRTPIAARPSAHLRQSHSPTASHPPAMQFRADAANAMVLPVELVPPPVLQPAPARRGRQRAAIGRRRRVGDARHRVALLGAVDVDRPEALEQGGAVGPRDRWAQQDQRERRYKCARSFQVVSDQPGIGMPSMTRSSS